MIPNEEKEGWHYRAVKKLSTLLRRITTKHHGDFYCLNCLHSFRTKNKLKSHAKICKNKDFCGIVMQSEKNDILEFNHYMRSGKIPYIIYAHIESLIRKIDGCASNPEKTSTTKIGKHIPRGYSMSTIWGFDPIEDKHTLYCRKDSMKKFCTSLKEHAKNIIDFEKKCTVSKKRSKTHQDAKVCYICRKRILTKFPKDRNRRKVRDHCHYTGKYEAQHIVFVI